jgi:hypothetical protein
LRAAAAVVTSMGAVWAFHFAGGWYFGHSPTRDEMGFMLWLGASPSPAYTSCSASRLGLSSTTTSDGCSTSLLGLGQISAEQRPDQQLQPTASAVSSR